MRVCLCRIVWVEVRGEGVLERVCVRRVRA